ncbi:MAG: hypothetical protein QJR12_05155 [Mycobacterium sp.]|uniref:hypothetical protein n=1 Tax=Mycobacterium sp. TaxID=1785 RepID=UPI00261F614C|nr:hypothetical protein [Mycobacterium sp.]MDI3313677.1 hypothetical protein [Mycobacterium sp.]
MGDHAVVLADPKAVVLGVVDRVESEAPRVLQGILTPAGNGAASGKLHTKGRDLTTSISAWVIAASAAWPSHCTPPGARTSRANASKALSASPETRSHQSAKFPR